MPLESRHRIDPWRLTNLRLLTIEVGTLWPRERGDGRAHDEPQPQLVIVAADTGLAAIPRPGIPAELAAQLVHIVDAAPPPELGQPPSVLQSCKQLLAEIAGPLETAAGPSYVVQQPTPVPPPDATGCRIITSEDAAVVASCAESWEPAEWDQLLAGEHGPWAMALAPDESVVAICHTPVWSSHAAEAGVWTHPDARGQGHAARVTATWAGLRANRDRLLFYSTWAENRSSQRVAARLGLRPIGWLWKLRT